MLQMANTYSITAVDIKTGQMGVAVQTHQMGVGQLVPWVQIGVGAIATQSLVNVGYGPVGLDMLAEGKTPDEVIAALTASDPAAYHRQVGVVRADGLAAAFTGEHCIAHAGHFVGQGYSVQANMMTNPTVIDAMRSAYENTSGDLTERMMAAMFAAQAEGGDIRGMQSAALVIVPPLTEDSRPWDKLFDFRVDEHPHPLDELARLVRMRRASYLSDYGDQLLRDGRKEEALQVWAQARQLAPDLEEMVFWQAIELANDGDLRGAAVIFAKGLANDPLRDQWIALIPRMERAKLLTRPGTAAALLAALGLHKKKPTTANSDRPKNTNEI